VRFAGMLMSLLAMLVRSSGVFLAFIMPAMTMLMGRLDVVMSGSRMMCGGGMMMFDGGMLRICHDHYSLLAAVWIVFDRIDWPVSVDPSIPRMMMRT
jgi:hypothetical protein